MSRDSVLTALSRELERPLVLALETAGRRLAGAFPVEQQAVARAVLLSMAAKAIERGGESAYEEAHLAATGMSEAHGEANSVANEVTDLARRVRGLVAAGDPKAARDCAKRLVELAPGDPDARMTRAHVELLLGELKAAQDELLRAGFLVHESDLERRADIAAMFVAVARAWRDRGDTSMCRLQLERALRQSPSSQPAQELARELDRPSAAPTPRPIVAANGMANSQASVMANGMANAQASVMANTVASGKPRAPLSAPLVSIVIARSHDEAHVEACLASVERHTTVAHEIIVVDDGTSDDVGKFLERYSANRPHVIVAVDTERRGTAYATNLGTSLARGHHVVWLASDTVVTPAWLEGMLAVFQAHPKAGVVGPRTNATRGRQFAREATYDRLAALDEFAARWADSHRAESAPANHLSQTCVMMRAEVVATIGGLDARFCDGPFASTDFVWRARLARFACRVADEVFVHQDPATAPHLEPTRADDRTAQSFELLKQKWGIDPSRTLADGFPRSIVPPASVIEPMPLVGTAAAHAPSPSPVAHSRREAGPLPAAPSRSADLTSAERQALFTQGERAAEHGDWRRAGEIFEELTRAAPDYVPALVGLASASFAVGNVERGAAALGQACELEPRNTSLKLQRAVALAHGKLPERALEAFVAVLKDEPSHRDALLGAAQLARRLRRYVDAVELLDRAVASSPDDADVLVEVGTLAAELGDKRAAEQAVEHLRRIAPTHAALTALNAAASRDAHTAAAR